MKTRFRSLIVALIGAFCWTSVALAAGGDSWSSGPSEDPAIAQAQAAIQAKDWPRAAAVMRAALAAHPDSADYHNLYAYALRKGPNPDMNEVFRHYEEALRLDPKHRNAHEYIGEAYLQVGNLAKAKEHLAALDKLCFLSCEQYRDLKQAIADYEAKHR
ncbi:MAG TPA: tetratricopeptide repeat protein [Burkholderiales bacterium]|nr:tetratricopeptide repeat protein [Burkholderiales bacterium]